MAGNFRRHISLSTEILATGSETTSEPPTTFSLRPPRRPLLMITQSDVTMRTHVEMAMAQLTESQLGMLSQVWQY